MSEYDELRNEVNLWLASDSQEPMRTRIHEQIDRAEIRYIFEDQRAARPYGSVKKLKQELALKYNYSLKTIEDIIYG